MRGQMALAGPAGLHRPTTGGTARPLLPASRAQISRPTCHGHVLEHMGPQPGQPFVHRSFDRLQGSLGMLVSPCLEAYDHLFAQRPPPTSTIEMVRGHSTPPL